MRRNTIFAGAKGENKAAASAASFLDFILLSAVVMTIPISITGFIKVLPVLFYLHPIHVSVTEIEFDKADKALEIMMRVFIDDLELTLRNSTNNPELDILNPPKETSVDKLMDEYLKTHFKISLDNQSRKTHYLGHEREGEAFVFFIEVRDVQQWNTITIRNDIIMSTYDDQSNLVHVYVGDKVKSLRLTTRTPGDKLTFD